MLKRSPRFDDVWGRHMDDYSALAYRIAGGVADVRGCLILSRDGLILGSYPDDETAVKPAWVRFASLGEPERSFVEFGDQVWVYVRRPAYGAFAVANAGVRPGSGDRSARGHPDVGRGVPEPSRHAPRARGLRGTDAGRTRPAIDPTSSRRTGAPTSTPPAPDSAEARHWSRTTPAADDGDGRRPGRGGAGAGGERRRPLGGCDR